MFSRGFRMGAAAVAFNFFRGKNQMPMDSVVK